MRDAYWHCEWCGDHAPADEPYEVGDSEPCTECGEGVSRVMTLRDSAQFESEVARGIRKRRRAYADDEATRP